MGVYTKNVLNSLERLFTFNLVKITWLLCVENVEQTVDNTMVQDAVSNKQLPQQRSISAC